MLLFSFLPSLHFPFFLSDHSNIPSVSLPSLYSCLYFSPFDSSIGSCSVGQAIPFDFFSLLLTPSSLQEVAIFLIKLSLWRTLEDKRSR